MGDFVQKIHFPMRQSQAVARVLEIFDGIRYGHGCYSGVRDTVVISNVDHEDLRKEAL
jgi:hypothetical protein